MIYKAIVAVVVGAVIGYALAMLIIVIFKRVFHG